MLLSFTNNLSPFLTENIKKHHDLYPEIPIKGIYSEYILYKSLQELELNPSWDIGSHTVGTDLIVNDLRISCKSGKIKNKILRVSSYRTTKYKTLKEKIEYINIKHQDYIFCLVQCKKHYRYFIIDNNDLQMEKINWGIKNNDYYGENDIGVNCLIVSAMSDQLWIDIPLKITKEIII